MHALLHPGTLTARDSAEPPLPSLYRSRLGAPDCPRACPARYHFWMLVRRLRVGILTTRSARGLLTSRQVQTCNGKNDVGRVLRFLVSVDCLWVRDIALDPNVCVVYADGIREQFVSVSGEGQVRRCEATQQALWNTVAMRHFPGGPSDPLLRILEVHIQSAIVQDGPEHHELTCADFANETREVRGSARKPVARHSLQPLS